MVGVFLACSILTAASAADSSSTWMTTAEARKVTDPKDYIAQYAAAYGDAPTPDITIGSASESPTIVAAPGASPVAVQAIVAESSATGALVPEFLMSVEKCHTLKELRMWREHHTKQVKQFVPPGVQKFASDALETDYWKRFAELQHTDAQGARPFPDMLEDAQGCQSPEELEGWSEAISAHIQHFFRPEHRERALADVKKHFDRRLDQLHRMIPVVDPTAVPLGHLAFPEFLQAVDKCESEQELQVWRTDIIDFVQEHVPPELKPLALADAQKHFELRLAKIREVATEIVGSSIASNMGIAVARPPLDPPAVLLGEMLKEADHCGNEKELRNWRQRVAAHIRESVPPRFQVPAVGDMQMRFESRLDVLQKASSNAKAVAGDKDVVAMASSAPDLGQGGGVAGWMLVLAGLSLPALIAFVGGVARSRRTQVSLSKPSSDTCLLKR